MHEIVADIFTWAWFSEPHGYNFNGYFVRHNEGNLCVDPVPPSEETLADIARMGVASLLLTNRNHSRGERRPRSHRCAHAHSPGRRRACSQPGR